MLHRFALLGLIVGFIAVCMAAFENNFIRPPAPAPDTATLKETASKAAKKWLDDKILHKPKTAPLDRKELPHHPYQMFYIGLGLVAVGLGVASWCRRENLRMSGAAISLGIMAICWQWVLIGVTVAIAIMVIFLFLT